MIKYEVDITPRLTMTEAPHFPPDIRTQIKERKAKIIDADTWESAQEMAEGAMSGKYRAEFEDEMKRLGDLASSRTLPADSELKRGMQVALTMLFYNSFWTKPSVAIPFSLHEIQGVVCKGRTQSTTFRGGGIQLSNPKWSFNLYGLDGKLLASVSYDEKTWAVTMETHEIPKTIPHEEQD